MASGIYNRLKYNLMAKMINLANDTIKCALLDDSHAYSATHNTWSEVSANELAASGNYSTGGATVSSKVVVQAATTKWDAADTTWASATFSAYHAVLYDDDLAGDDLIASIDFGGVQTVSSGTFTIQWHADGIITLA